MARKNQKAPWEPEEEIIWVSKIRDETRIWKHCKSLGVELVEPQPSSTLKKMPLSLKILARRDYSMHNALKTKRVVANCSASVN